MYSLLLAIIYIAFISLGLPDSLLGSAWPVMYPQLGVPISYAGILSMIVAGGTIVSGLMSARLTRRFGAGIVTAVSVMMTAIALLGCSFSKHFIVLCLWAIPYGLGAGAVDAALNNYVALHYASRHMSWLHCFWGIGASVSPYIMGHFLATGYRWSGGYLTVGIVQIVLTAILFFSLPLWKKHTANKETKNPPATIGLRQALKIKGVKYILIAFFCYCALEVTTGLWASSYLVGYHTIDAETAAKFASLFYLGITFGRFLNGFIADKVKDNLLIRIGIIIVMIGVVLVGIPTIGKEGALAGLIIIGLGCAPIYPSIIHATPMNFGPENSHAIIGIQMASAYLGTTLMPPLFGLIADKINIGLYPVYLFLFAVLMLAMSEILNRTISRKNVQNTNPL